MDGPKDPIEQHNRRSIDKASADFVDLFWRAVREKPNGSVTLKLEWRAYQACRFVTNEEQSELLPVE